MSKISTYDNAGTPTLNDKVIGTEVAADPANSTKNFTLAQIVKLFNAGTVPGGFTSTSAGVAGQVLIDKVSNKFYICVDTNNWRVMDLSTF